MTTEKTLTPSDPEFLPVQYDMTEAKLKELAVMYDASNIPEAKEKGDDGYLVIHEKAMSIVKVRTSIEKKRKSLKSDALAWGKKVDTEAKRLVDIVLALEEPWRKIKDNLDEKEAKEAEVKRLEEQKRLEAIEKKVAAIKDLTAGLVGNDSKALSDRLEVAHDLAITESEYGDYVEAATLIKQTVTDVLTKALAERVTFEAEQAALKAEKDEQAKEAAKLQKEKDDLARERLEMEEAKADQDALAEANRQKEQAELDRQREELEQAQADQKAREDAEEARKLQEAKDKQDEIDRVEAEKQAAIEAEKAAEQQKADEKRNKAALKKRLPEDIKVQEYVDELLEIEVPAVKNPLMKVLVVDIRTELKRVQLMVSTRTQDGEK